MTSSSTTIGTKTGRARRTFGQLWQIPLFFVGLAALLGVAASTPWRLTPQEAEFRRYLISLRRDLAHDSADGDALANQAENLLLRVGEFPRQAAEAHFLAGSAFDRQAQAKPAAQAQELWTRAVQNLEKAKAIGVVDDDLPPLQYRLGHSLFRQNKELARAVDLMTMAVEKGANHPADGYRVLIDANLQGPQPNVDAALAASRRMLDLIPENQVEALAQARLQCAELLLRKSRRADAVRELEQIGANAPTPVRVKARLLQARACEADGGWKDAAAIWKELLRDPAQVPGGAAFLHYRLGWCYHEMKPAQYAKAIRVWTEAVKLGDAPGQAAGIHLGELRLALGDEQSAQALADWSEALKNVKSASDFNNPLVEIAQVRALFDHAIDLFQDKRDIEKTQAAAELYRRITPGGVAEQRMAHIVEAYAQHLAEMLKAKAGAVKEADVFNQYRAAGKAFESASQAGDAKQRPDMLWRAIQCHLAARDILHAQEVLLQYVDVEKNEERLAEGWFTIGDLYQLTGQKLNAYAAFVKCRAYPETIFAARADYHLAEREIENGKAESAQEILTKIITGASNQIDAPTREKAHFRLATLLLSLNQFAKAQVYLKACVTLYPANPANLVVREQLGECCRQLAKNELDQYFKIHKFEPANPDDRPQWVDRLSNHRQKHKNWLDEAHKSYFGLMLALEKQTKPLTNLEKTLLRRAWFGMGDCKLDGENYSEALRLFQEVQTKHRGTLESLYACSRLVDTIGQMMETTSEPAKLREQALASIKMLLADMKDLPVEHEMFRLPRVPPRSKWLEWAEETQRKFAIPAKAESTLPAFR